jgi:hypothetical protein
MWVTSVSFESFSMGLCIVQDITSDLEVFNLVIGLPDWPWTACNSVNFPGTTWGACKREDPGQAAAYNACGTYYEGHALVLWWCITILLRFFPFHLIK